jgi:hypothetical protein
MARVNVSVEDEQKNRWEEHVEDSPEYTTLSQLVRSAIEAEIADEAGSQSLEGPGMNQDFLEQFGELKSEIRDVKDRLGRVEENVKQNPELEELASEVFDILPTKDDLTPKATVWFAPSEGLLYAPVGKSVLTGEQEQVPAEDVSDDELSRTGQIESFAHILGESSHKMQEAVEKLTGDTAMVRSETVDGEVRYYRRK